MTAARLQLLASPFSICRLADFSAVDLSLPFCFTARTDEEFSLVCPTGDAPASALSREDGWRAFRFAGVLDFSLTGILSRITGLLAGEAIGLFALSTYNTDYVLMRETELRRALALLTAHGYSIETL